MLTAPQAGAVAALLTAAAFASHVIPDDAAAVATASGWLLRMLALVAWVFAISVWHVNAQHRVGERHHRQMLKRVRRLSGRLEAMETRVNELSSDRTQAAAVVTKLFKEPHN